MKTLRPNSILRGGLAAALMASAAMLAPAAASFDQYPNFEKRGEDFVKLVLSLQDA